MRKFKSITCGGTVNEKKIAEDIDKDTLDIELDQSKQSTMQKQN